MDLESFEAALDAYGADLGVWPTVLRERALALLKTSSEAHALLDAEISLRDALMTRRRTIQAPAGLAARIVTQAVEQSPPPSKGSQAWEIPDLRRSFLRPLDLLALCGFFVLGAIFGHMGTDTGDATYFDSYYSSPWIS